MTKKKMTRYKYLGFLGLLGLLGIATDNAGFFGFFGFFSFFAVTAKPDERLAENTHKAGFTGFVVGLIGLSLLVTALAMDAARETIALITAGAFIAVILAFVISFMRYEKG
ncbi:DUF3796 domain-containing protein [Candidatus Woesearchaeota archaeon]|nr:DUF3796 domain-containing protein [Candidatus Woesearchaeota archaeon]